MNFLDQQSVFVLGQIFQMSKNVFCLALRLVELVGWRYVRNIFRLGVSEHVASNMLIFSFLTMKIFCLLALVFVLPFKYIAFLN